MMHSFDCEVAMLVGTTAATIFQYIGFFVKDAKDHMAAELYKDGRYWKKATIKGFGNSHPYLSTKSTRTALDKLVEAGLIEKGCFNDDPYNRTMWYTLTETGWSYLQNGYSRRAENGSDTCAENGSSILNVKTSSLDSYKETPNKLGVKKSGANIPPTLEEVREYLVANDYAHLIDASAFIAFYDSKGWMIGKNRMKDWHGAVGTWVARAKKERESDPQPVRNRASTKEELRNIEENTEFNPDGTVYLGG